MSLVSFKSNKVKMWSAAFKIAQVGTSYMIIIMYRLLALYVLLVLYLPKVLGLFEVLYLLDVLCLLRGVLL